jgi:predicted MFS family arabinose efflux permease
MSVGNILGLLTYTVAARFYETNILFYVSAFFCLAAALMLWRLGQEPEITLERNPFSFRLLHNVESHLSLRPILHSLDVRRIRVPQKLDQVKPLQLLLLTAFVHWLGISFWFVGITPLMRELGLSDSLILALNVANGVASAASFVWIAPRMKNNYKKLGSLVLSRAGVILCWAALPYFLVHTTPLVFVFPLLLSIIFNVLYAMIWLPLTNFAISQAPEEHKSSVVGQLMSATGVAGAVGSILGGLAITTYGYTVGFIIASAIVVLSIPIVSRMDAIDLDK